MASIEGCFHYFAYPIPNSGLFRCRDCGVYITGEKLVVFTPLEEAPADDE